MGLTTRHLLLYNRYMTSTPSITCGKCKNTHSSVAAVKACHDNGGGLEDEFLCPWLVETTTYCGDDEFGYEPYTRTVDCGAPAFGFDWGWTCTAGHRHNTYGGPRHTEYYDDDEVGAIRRGLAPLPSGRWEAA